MEIQGKYNEGWPVHVRAIVHAAVCETAAHWRVAARAIKVKNTWTTSRYQVTP